MAEKPKMMFILTSGVDGKEKVISGLRMAINIAKSGSAQEVKIMFFGPSEDMISKPDPVLDGLLSDASSAGIYKTACVNIAENKGIKDTISKKGILLEPAGKVLVDAMSEGFIPITF